MFDIQYIVVALIVFGAIGYAALVFIKKSRGFSTKTKCADDCGCSSSKSKTPKIAH